MRHRNAFTEISWEDAEWGLGTAMSTVASEKNRELFIGNVFYKQWHLCVLVLLVFRGHELLKIANFHSRKEPDFRYGKN